MFKFSDFCTMSCNKFKKLIAIALIAEAVERAEAEELIEHHRRGRRRRSVWTRQWILRRNSQLRGTLNLAHVELRIEDNECFQKFFRMRNDLFDRLVEMITPYIQRQDTNMRECIAPRERLSLTLRFLATGESYRSLEYSTRIPACTISRIIPETCRVLYEILQKQYLQVTFKCIFKNIFYKKYLNKLYKL